ncbi:hypothetical protein RRG08_057367 [Elysia crispata]|uniref:Uncharacterized protein n=1 Tax=Elysia crispata TaxID=231223 RepID=A0AAE1D0C0_9GAST|nr:hypothetical protein RRG08_057367 [Elysia crispata]
MVAPSQSRTHPPGGDRFCGFLTMVAPVASPRGRFAIARGISSLGGFHCSGDFIAQGISSLGGASPSLGEATGWSAHPSRPSGVLNQSFDNTPKTLALRGFDNTSETFPSIL